MIMRFRLILTMLFVGQSLVIQGCASTPKETVELSYIIGGDLAEIQRSYHLLVEMHFDSIYLQVNRKIDEVYIRAYLFGTAGNPGFVETGQLVRWVEENDALGIADWAEIAIRQIDTRRRAELKPFEDAEQELLQSIDDSFEQLKRANATITAHLNSLRKVQEVQDSALEALDIKDLRDSINTTLIDISNQAAAVTAELESKKETINKLFE